MKVVMYQGYKVVPRFNAYLILTPAGKRMAIVSTMSDAFQFVDGCTQRFSFVYNNPQVEGVQ